MNYDMQEEQMNFNCHLLAPFSVSRYEQIDWKGKLKGMNSLYRDEQLREEDLYQEPGVAELQEVLNKLYKEISQNPKAVSKDSSRAMMGKFLYVNGEMDEKDILRQGRRPWRPKPAKRMKIRD